MKTNIIIIGVASFLMVIAMTQTSPENQVWPEDKIINSTSTVDTIAPTTTANVVEKKIVEIKKDIPVTNIVYTTLQNTNQIIMPVATSTIVNTPITPIVQPKTETIIVYRQEIPTASAPMLVIQPTQSMDTLYKINKGDTVVKENISEQEVRDFAQSLNDQYINWRNHMQQDPLIQVGDALKSNGYILTLNGETIITK